MLLSRKKVVALAVETTPGTAESLTDTNAFVVFDPEITPDENFEERAAQGTFSQEAGVQGPQTGTGKFRIEIYGNGSSTPAGWTTVVLPALGLVASGSVFKPKSEAPGSNVKTLTYAIYNDGLIDKLYGCAGDGTFNFENGKIASLDVNLKGIFSRTSGAAITPTYPTIRQARFDHASVLWTGTTSCSKATIALNNDVQLVGDATKDSGVAHACIVGRKIGGTLNPEASAANVNHTALTANTEASLTIEVHGATASKTTFSFVMPKAQRTKVPVGDDNGIRRDDVTFQANRNTTSGDDELVLTCS